jgi:predicted nucleic acid-binding protein
VALNILLDSVILIDHFNGLHSATSYLKRVYSRSSISVITRAEVLTGFEVGALKSAMQLLDRFPVLPIDREAADLAASLRREHGWKLPDAFQAALARIHNLKLATRNTRDFPPDRFEFVVAPYTVS